MVNLKHTIIKILKCMGIIITTPLIILLIIVLLVQIKFRDKSLEKEIENENHNIVGIK